VLHTVDYAVSDSPDGSETMLSFKPVY